MDGSEAGVDFVLIQTFPLYYVNQAILMKLVFFNDNFYNKKQIRLYKSPSASHTTVKRSIGERESEAGTSEAV